jgi:hypothetical protein
VVNVATRRRVEISLPELFRHNEDGKAHDLLQIKDLYHMIKRACKESSGDGKAMAYRF